MSQLFMLQKNRDDAEIIFRGASHSRNNESQSLPCLPLFCPSSQPLAENLSWWPVKLMRPLPSSTSHETMPKNQAWEERDRKGEKKNQP